MGLEVFSWFVGALRAWDIHLKKGMSHGAPHGKKNAMVTFIRIYENEPLFKPGFSNPLRTYATLS